MTLDTKGLRDKVLRLVAEDGHAVAARLVAATGISRQTASVQVQALLTEGLIVAEGATRSRIYRLAPLREAVTSHARAGLEEDQVWRNFFAPHFADLPENVRDIWRYGVTEMINNAIDHSESERVEVGIRRDALNTEAWVADEGAGIFLKIQAALNLFDPREAILELAKGKLTTDPGRHTGEGIFFTSWIFDSFDIQSGRLHFSHGPAPLDRLAEHAEDVPGTIVRMRLTNDSPRDSQDVFSQFAGPDEFTFSRTVVPVRLAQYEGEKLVSRSQAKRLTRRFERFSFVVLDFEGVTEIGQAFADELFRVFAAANPAVQLSSENTMPAVQRMIQRALAGAAK